MTTLVQEKPAAVEAMFDFPFDGTLFTEEGQTLARAPVLEDIVTRLIAERNEFKDLQQFQFAVLWKRGKMKWLGQVMKQGERALLLSGCHFVIEVCYTACREHACTARRMEALLYHELCHLFVDEGGKLSTVPHDVEEFHAVVARYGVQDEAQRVFVEQLKLALEG